VDLAAEVTAGQSQGIGFPPHQPAAPAVSRRRNWEKKDHQVRLRVESGRMALSTQDACQLASGTLQAARRQTQNFRVCRTNDVRLARIILGERKD